MPEGGWGMTGVKCVPSLLPSELSPQLCWMKSELSSARAEARDPVQLDDMLFIQ